MVMIYRKSLRLGSVPGGISDVGMLSCRLMFSIVTSTFNRVYLIQAITFALVNLLSNDCNR